MRTSGRAGTNHHLYAGHTALALSYVRNFATVCGEFEKWPKRRSRDSSDTKDNLGLCIRGISGLPNITPGCGKSSLRQNSERLRQAFINSAICCAENG